MSKRKILIVEDEPEMRKLLTIELESAGYQVFLAGDGESGFKLAQEAMPDLIVCDIMLPKVDGNQLMKKLRGSSFGKDIPFIVLTARRKMRDYFETMAVDDFIEKPFKPEDLLAKIEKVLGRPAKDPAGTAKPAPSAKAVKKKILILEDDQWLCPRLESIFGDYGYEVKIMSSVPECLEEAVRFCPDIILSKYVLEGMSGAQLVGLVKGMPSVKDIPVLIYSNTILGGEQESALSAGAVDFLIDASGIKLLKRVNELLKM